MHRANVGDWHSPSDLALRPDPCYRAMMKMIVDHVGATHSKIVSAMGLAPSPPWGFAAQAWAMVMRNGDYTIAHDHGEAHWSTTYYVDAGNADQNVIGFVRFDGAGSPGIACLANLSPVVRHGFRVGLPQPGRWDEVVNTDSIHYGGSGQGNLGSVDTEPVAWHAWGDSALVTLPPFAA